MITSKELHELLTQAGYEPRPYSGRVMFGRRCIGVDVDSVQEYARLMFKLGFFFAPESGGEEGMVDFPMPLMDSLGRGYIVYWFDAEWEEGFEEN